MCGRNVWEPALQYQRHFETSSCNQGDSASQRTASIRQEVCDTRAPFIVFCLAWVAPEAPFRRVEPCPPGPASPCHWCLRQPQSCASRHASAEHEGLLQQRTCSWSAASSTWAARLALLAGAASVALLKTFAALSLPTLAGAAAQLHGNQSPRVPAAGKEQAGGHGSRSIHDAGE